MTVKGIMPLNGEELRFNAEQFFRGNYCDPRVARQLSYHQLMKMMHCTWVQLMETPYRVILRHNIFENIENLMRSTNGGRMEVREG